MTHGDKIVAMREAEANAEGWIDLAKAMSFKNNDPVPALLLAIFNELRALRMLTDVLADE